MSALVCITGMHRSGTSMVARALAAAGLWLGPADRLMPPQADNRQGFFENLDLVRLDDELLDRLGGAWDCPPPRAAEPAGALVMPLAARGVELLAALLAGAQGTPAGWKDPRAALLLPFWRSLAPQLRLVVCLRHPLAAARSLRERNRVSLRYGVALWQAYNEALLGEVLDGRAVVTHYDAWLADPSAELARVTEAVGLRSAQVDAGTLVAPPRPAATAERPDALLALAGARAVQLYEALCARAGAVFERTAEGRRSGVGCADLPPRPPTGTPASDEVQLLRHRIAELDSKLARTGTAPALYRFGTLIDARKGGNAPLYLENGWAAPQDAGTWSLGACATVRLSPHALVPGAGAAVDIRLRALAGPGHPLLTVTLRFNDRAAASWTFDEAPPVSVGCVLDAGLLQSGQALQLDFDIDRPRSPSALGRSADTRPLGFLLQSLRLRAVAPDGRSTS